MNETFFQFSMLIGGATLFAFILRLLKQPTIIAYLLFGAFLGFMQWPGLSHAITNLQFFSGLGTTLLLFLVGLELTTIEIGSFSKKIIGVSLAQVLITLGVGYIILRFLFSDPLEIFIGAIALVFSSTVLSITMFTKQGALKSLHARISLGILLFQDLVAVIIFVMLTPANSNSGLGLIAFLVLKILLLLVITFILSKYCLPQLLKLVARDSELVFLFGIAWALVFATVVAKLFGFNLEAGGFLAGLSLANTASHYQIAARIRPLRDLFLMIFFVYLGTKVDFALTTADLILVGILFLITIIIKPLIVFVVLGFAGYRKRTSFLTAISLGQISEFSFILVNLALIRGIVSAHFASITMLMGILGLIVSTLLMTHADFLYNFCKKYLGIFDRWGTTASAVETELDGHTIVIGYGRKGEIIVKALENRGHQLVVVDQNPELSKEVPKGVNFILGDINDDEIQELAFLNRADLIFSTAMNPFDDLALLNHFKWFHHKPVIVVSAKTDEEAEKLYENGAGYVLLPQHIAGEYLASIIKEFPSLKSKFGQLKTRHQKLLAKSIS